MISIFGAFKYTKKNYHLRCQVSLIFKQQIFKLRFKNVLPGKFFFLNTFFGKKFSFILMLF